MMVLWYLNQEINILKSSTTQSHHHHHHRRDMSMNSHDHHHHHHHMMNNNNDSVIDNDPMTMIMNDTSHQHHDHDHSNHHGHHNHSGVEVDHSTHHIQNNSSSIFDNEYEPYKPVHYEEILLFVNFASFFLGVLFMCFTFCCAPEPKRQPRKITPSQK